MLYFGEKLINIWMWSGHASASIISISFCSHSWRSIWPISFLIWSQITILQYFGANTTWYWHLHAVWLKRSTSLLSFISKINLPVPRMWLANPHSILPGGFFLSRAKAFLLHQHSWWLSLAQAIQCKWAAARCSGPFSVKEESAKMKESSYSRFLPLVAMTFLYQ